MSCDSVKNDLISALDTLASQSESSAFACKLQLPAEALKIAVKAVGNIRLPVSNSRARTLILNLFSFYADCTHEIKPITDGYRVALSYNLSFTPAKLKRSERPTQDTTELQLALNAFFKRAAYSVTTEDRSSPEKLVYLLDHQYTQRSLSWNRMKGSDKARVDALKSAATALDMHVNLSLVDINELWTAYETNDSDYDGSMGLIVDTVTTKMIGTMLRMSLMIWTLAIQNQKATQAISMNFRS